MTEEEARTKMCCGPATTGQLTLLDERQPLQRLCVAASCMAWRWTDDIERRWTADAPEGEGWQHVEAIGGVAHWARTHKTPHGYCGLAGPP